MNEDRTRDENHTLPKKKKWEMPDTYVIVFLILIVAAAATYIVPAGVFDREEVDGVTQVISGTFTLTEQMAAASWTFLWRFKPVWWSQPG